MNPTENTNIKVEKLYYPSGAIEIEIPYVNGEIHGVEKGYHTSGTLWREAPYVNGKKHGIRKVYHKNSSCTSLRIRKHHNKISNAMSITPQTLSTFLKRYVEEEYEELSFYEDLSDIIEEQVETEGTTDEIIESIQWLAEDPLYQMRMLFLPTRKEYYKTHYEDIQKVIKKYAQETGSSLIHPNGQDYASWAINCALGEILFSFSLYLENTLREQN